MLVNPSGQIRPSLPPTPAPNPSPTARVWGETSSPPSACLRRAPAAMADAKDAVELFPNPIASDPHPLSLHPHSSLTSLLRQVVDGEAGQGRGASQEVADEVRRSYRCKGADLPPRVPGRRASHPSLSSVRLYPVLTSPRLAAVRSTTARPRPQRRQVAAAPQIEGGRILSGQKSKI